ncbi:S-layer homology domain-containing protein [bacterium]|nr:S-layer homology domain-containing protein [bacterium]NCQ55186.1 S-layer homology domain-containing protein [Candidatus Parcubacteria bacterium]NCS67301.1 S-layer homology domain-containing protein [Candidatus Peregrinibacteria bacterium]NCS96556.1 S-layer homology domain-containing protein [bacterium]
MKLFSTLAIGLLGIVNTANAQFADVSGFNPHADAIAYVQAEGIVAGYADGTFKPNDTINRAELVKIIVESSGRPANCETSFSYIDVPVGAWYLDYLDNARCLGVVGGYPDNTFKPGNAVLMTEAAKIISKGLNLPVAESNGAWFESFINYLASKNAIPLDINSIDSELTRGQMAEIIFRLKTGNTSFQSHTLQSLMLGQSNSLDAQVDLDFEAELNALLEMLSEEGLMEIDQ